MLGVAFSNAARFTKGLVGDAAHFTKGLVGEVSGCTKEMFSWTLVALVVVALLAEILAAFCFCLSVDGLEKCASDYRTLTLNPGQEW